MTEAPKGGQLVTLHIEHPITDYETWFSAFSGFTEARRRAGVRDHRVQHPVDDRRYIVIDLDFDTAGEAATFLDFLQSRVWAAQKNSPALSGAPKATILESF
ncbi:MAG: hypothetical protein QOH48_2088 [Actinomycetota bacterium]|nr:hypothetical protein [Actinomycetota bacterium]